MILKYKTEVNNQNLILKVLKKINNYYNNKMDQIYNNKKTIQILEPKQRIFCCYIKKFIQTLYIK